MNNYVLALWILPPRLIQFFEVAIEYSIMQLKAYSLSHSPADHSAFSSCQAVSVLKLSTEISGTDMIGRRVYFGTELGRLIF